MATHTCTTTAGTAVPCACPAVEDHGEDGILDTESELTDMAHRNDVITG